MHGLNHNEEVTCENCGTETREKNFVRHKEMLRWDTFLHWIDQILKNVSDWL